jgi:TRAP-type C4-dicarboxylate transport system substrate-binding protein
MVLAISVLLVGCGEDAAVETTEGGGSAVETTEGGGSADVITLKYADQNPATGWGGSESAEPFLKKIEEATGGRVKIERYFGETLFKGPDAWESVKAGVADFAWCFHGYMGGMTPLMDVVALPFLPFETATQASAILWQLYEEFPSIQAELADNHILVTWTSGPYYLWTTEKPVKTLDDIKGMKIRTIGGPPTKLIEAMGAVPVSIPMPETYQAIQTGVVDGMLEGWESVYSFRHYELYKYLTPVNFHVVYFSLPFNKQKWDSLPADIQTAIEGVCKLEGSKFWGTNFYDRIETTAENALKEQGYEIERVLPADEDVEAWRAQFGEPIWEEWVKAREADGHPEARDILNRTLELIETTPTE